MQCLKLCLQSMAPAVLRCSLAELLGARWQCVVFWSLYRAAVELGVSEATALPDSPLARQPSWYLKQAARTIQVSAQFELPDAGNCS